MKRTYQHGGDGKWMYGRQGMVGGWLLVMGWVLLTACTAVVAADPATTTGQGAGVSAGEAGLKLDAKAAFPQVTLRNGLLEAVVYLPDKDRGYYRGTRFDWSGMVRKVQMGSTVFFDLSHEEVYDPLESALGLVDEFGIRGPLGYDQVMEGGKFVKIGVGELIRDGEKYAFNKYYEMADGGVWRLEGDEQGVKVTQELKGTRGWGYVYTKEIRLAGDRPELVIRRTLRNTGTQKIDTEHYNHHFMTINHEAKMGPAYRVEYPFVPVMTGTFNDQGVAKFEEKSLVFSGELPSDKAIYGKFTGFGATAEDHRVKVVHVPSGAWVEAKGSLPLARCVLWGVSPVISPEMFVRLEVEPGQEVSWETQYRFGAGSGK